ncbi:prepilin-type N-terminal cleavage/methylation domain-containing protein [Desulfovibrio oxamicus]|uniref:Prepilin-type N-terminal cleavage/methylation domain-containing protein n=1 Tax=Nitratidesulfovibrio oxamicus TaxID=32016 RepID=A0ABS0IZN3_9BACT|nr:prepilin-type N-terminal cleavage/methylation domain-containing protein [Nitratidesulfovibrio oxamicus]MBG3875636.1 prepilin-type N-terminal cleavage/methylation domain-containing protein [Nitratidesulfovibrio oxamicus]
MTQSKKDRKKEQGFTLIEIVAVLVILGILAAVAIPRYFDMQAAAAARTIDATAAELQARVTQEFARQLLLPANNGNCGDALEAVTAANIGALGNGWTYTVANLIPIAAAEAGTAKDVTFANAGLTFEAAADMTRNIQIPNCN